MSSKFQMKKARKKALLAGSLVVAISTLGFAGYKITENIKGASATSFDFNATVAGYLGHGGLTNDLKTTTTVVNPSAAETPALFKDLKGATLPSSYNSREQSSIAGSPNGHVTKVEDQAKEGLCWAYSYTTTVESNILNTMSTYVELSPKQLDYMLVPSTTAFSNSATNPYYDFLHSLGLNRSLGDGGNGFISGYLGTTKVAPVSEAGFWTKLRANDSNLASYSSYADFIVALDDVYSVKQPSTNVLDESASEYTVTGWKEIDYLDYGEDVVSSLPTFTRSAAIEEIKNAIKTYGAVEIDSFFDINNCMYTTDNGTSYTSLTIIDKGDSVCAADTGHAMTIVGWDDNWSYMDGVTQKTGAFIIQNSWGAEVDAIPTYFAYDSDMNYYIINEVTQKPANGHIYDHTDKQDLGLTEAEDNIIFGFRSNNQEKIEKITFTQLNYIGAPAYSVYVSPTGTGNDWILAGTITTPYSGQYSITPSSNLIVDGNFAVKVVAELGFSENEKLLDFVTVVTANYSGTDPTDDPADDPTDDPTDEPSDPTDPTDPTDDPTDDPADTPTDPTDDPAADPTDEPSDTTDSDEEIPDVPDTGSKSKLIAFLSENALFLIPGFGAVVALSVASKNRKKHHLRNLWK